MLGEPCLRHQTLADLFRYRNKVGLHVVRVKTLGVDPRGTTLLPFGKYSAEASGV